MPEELARFKALMVRRREGEPVAYLTGHREFWSLDIQVTPAVLIPRPETETLVAAAVEAAKDFGGGDEGRLKPAPTVEPKTSPRTWPWSKPTENRKPKTETPSLWGLEVGVGSGAVVIALAKELPRMTWVGLDLSGRRPGRGPGQCPAAWGARPGPLAPGRTFWPGSSPPASFDPAGGQSALCAPGGVGTAPPGDQGV